MQFSRLTLTAGDLTPLGILGRLRSIHGGLAKPITRVDGHHMLLAVLKPPTPSDTNWPGALLGHSTSSNSSNSAFRGPLRATLVRAHLVTQVDHSGRRVLSTELAPRATFDAVLGVFGAAPERARLVRHVDHPVLRVQRAIVAPRAAEVTVRGLARASRVHARGVSNVDHSRWRVLGAEQPLLRARFPVRGALMAAFVATRDLMQVDHVRWAVLRAKHPLPCALRTTRRSALTVLRFAGVVTDLDHVGVRMQGAKRSHAALEIPTGWSPGAPMPRALPPVYIHHALLSVLGAELAF